EDEVEEGAAETDVSEQDGAARIEAGAEAEPPSVLCGAGRSGLDLAVVSILAQLLERKGYAVRVVTAEALAPEHLASCHVEDFDVICLSLIEGASAPRVQQTLRRLARRAPGKPLLVGTWSAADGEVGTRTQLPSQAKRVASLREAVEAVEQATRPARPYTAPGVPADEAERLRDIQALKALEARS